MFKIQHTVFEKDNDNNTIHWKPGKIRDYQTRIKGLFNLRSSGEGRIENLVDFPHPFLFFS